MKGVMYVIFLILLLFIGVPLAVGLTLCDVENNNNVEWTSQKIETPNKIKIWNEAKEKVEKINFEEYVCNVVASEMPSSFDKEALKAQAVASRTYAMAKIMKPKGHESDVHPKAPVCNTTHCQVYKTKRELVKAHGEDWEKNGYNKIKEACKETEGQMLYYDGKLVTQPLFFSSSGGQTENSEDVFSDEYPYLVSVSSVYEDGASHQNEQKYFDLEEFAEKINCCYTDRNTGEIGSNGIKILSRTAGGRVDRIQIGKSIYKGIEVRTALELSSSLFSVAIKDDEVVITSNGYGHGVGMSQYGANGMAKEGWTYKEILCHYYTGTEVY